VGNKKGIMDESMRIRMARPGTGRNTYKQVGSE